MKNDTQEGMTRFLLMMAIFITVWYLMTSFMPQPPDKSARPVANGSSPVNAVNPLPAAAGAVPPGGNLQAPANQAVAAAAAATGKVFADILVKRPAYTAEFTSRGAGMKNYRLNDFYDRPHDEKGARRLNLAAEMVPGHSSLRLSKIIFPPVPGQNTVLDMNNENWTLVAAPADCKISGVKETADQLIFEWTRGDFAIRRIFDFSAPAADEKKHFGFQHSLVFENRGTAPVTVSSYEMVAAAGIVPDDVDARFRPLRGVSGFCPKPNRVDREKDDFSKFKDSQEFAHNNRNIAYVGCTNRFFASLLLTANYQTSIAAHFRALPNGTDLAARLNPESDPQFGKVLAAHQFQGEAALTASGFVLAPRTSLERQYSYYGGPLDDNISGKFSPLLNNLVDFSWDFLKPLSVLLLWILQFFAGLVKNYGVAIILLTLVVKSVLHPLTRKSMKSQKAMQRIQPLLKEIKERYKKDPQKQQMETMRIFKENGVNPVGGCLPMLLQMPIFFALYGCFAYCFDIRQQPFIKGWIDDLSHPDTVYTFTDVPLFGDLAVNPLPLIYLVLQFFQMGMMPQSTDPQMQSQQKMMRMMPIIFVFIFYSMPAGLVLYFAVQSLLTLGEHFLLRMSKDDTPVIDGGMKTVDAKVIPAGTGFKKK